MKETNKDETFWAVLNAAIELEFVRGHQRWTMSELSRTSKITRSLIYYYFGKSKENILLEAVKLVGEELFGLSPQRLELWQKGLIAESVIQSRKLLEKAPHMSTFYMVHRNAETEIGASLRQLEKEQRQKLKRYFHDSSEPYLEALFGLLIGLVIAPKLPDAAVHKAVMVVKALVANPLEP